MAQNSVHIEKLNRGGHSKEEKHALLEAIIGEKIDSSVHVNLPFYSDFGRHISLGKRVFINCAVMFTDLGGIIIEDDVLIAPRVNILTVNHPLDVLSRRGVILSPVHLKRNCWIGAGVTIMSGVTIGENSVVASGALVRQDVPDNVVVAGVPAKMVKTLE